MCAIVVLDVSVVFQSWGDLMKKTAIMYIWYFMANSIAYASVCTLKEALTDVDITFVKAYVPFTVIAVLSVVSLFTYKIGSTVKACNKKCFGISFTEAITILVVISVVIDVLLLRASAKMLNMLMDPLDHLLFAGLCQIVPILLVVESK